MFPPRCLPFLMLSLVVVVRCADESTETLSEMKGDKLRDEEANETEWNATAAEPIDFSESDLRSVNKNFDKLGRVYVAQYYTLFDNPTRRLSLVSLYHYEDSFMSFEGERYRGTKKILEKYEKLKLKTVERSISSVDSQPLLDGGIVINVIGKVKANSDPMRTYAQTFIFKPQKGSFFLQHDIFRLIRD